MSVKDPCNTFNPSSKWVRALPSLIYIYGIFIEVLRWDNAPQVHSRVSNINFDI
jgi:hypothetical protein